jgi:hypothetical protein
VLKKTLLGFGLAAALALAPGASALASDIVAEGKAPCPGKESQCLRKSASGKSASAEPGSSGLCKRSAKAGQASASGDQNVASSGLDCPKSADCPKADCERSACMKKSGKAEAGTDGKPAAEAKVGTEI